MERCFDLRVMIRFIDSIWGGGFWSEALRLFSSRPPRRIGILNADVKRIAWPGRSLRNRFLRTRPPHAIFLFEKMKFLFGQPSVQCLVQISCGNRRIRFPFPALFPDSRRRIIVRFICPSISLQKGNVLKRQYILPVRHLSSRSKGSCLP